MERVVARLAHVVVVALRCVRTRPQRHNACRRFKLSPVAILPFMTGKMTPIATDELTLATKSNREIRTPCVSYYKNNDLCEYRVSLSILPFTARCRERVVVDAECCHEDLTN
jgi:hypothetical protein